MYLRQLAKVTSKQEMLTTAAVYEVGAAILDRLHRINRRLDQLEDLL